jgi:hypothetical protein
VKLKTNKSFVKKKDQKLKIKIIKTEVEIQTIKRLNCNFLGIIEKRRGKKTHQQQIRPPSITHTTLKKKDTTKLPNT